MLRKGYLDGLSFFLLRDRTGFSCEPGWRVAGWSNAPYPNRMGGETKAIVFEKTSPASESIMDVLADLEPGLYWCHGDIEMMDIRSN